MNMPGFTAENSLYDTHAPYRAGGAINDARGIFPAQFEIEDPGDFGGGGFGFGCLRCQGICRDLCRFSSRPGRCYVQCLRDICPLACP